MSPAAARKATAGNGRRPRGGRRGGRRALPGAGALGRLRAGEAIALVAAILLFVLMFFPWYGAQHSGANSLLISIQLFGGGTAWQALEVIPLFLMAAIAVAVGAALLRLIGSDWKPAIPPSAAVCVLGIVAALLILYRMISPPGISELENVPIERSLEIGIFLALAAALGIAYGGWRAMRDEGVSFAAIAKKLESPPRSRHRS